MRKLAALFLLLPVALVHGVELGQVQSVYILAMGSSFDQYLANRIASEQVFQVVTDPQRADAVLTDQIGPTFEDRLRDLYPPPEDPKPAKEDDEETGKMIAPPPMRTQSFGRGKGNLFLVDLKTRQVIWSIYERPKDLTPDELNRTSTRIIAALKKAVKGKTAPKP